MSDHTVTVTESARTTITAMRNQVAAIQRAWRHDLDLSTKALDTLTLALSNTLTGGFGDTKVHYDGDLSLLLATGITIGVMYFPAHRDVKEGVPGDPDMSYGAVRTGRYCMAEVLDDDLALTPRYCAHPYTWRGQDPTGTPTCSGHTPYPVTMPVPGEWSLHS